MKILYDGYIYDWQQYGGINRYFNEIIARLPAGDEPMVSTFLGRREFWPEHPRLRVLRSRPFASAPALAPLGRSWLSLRTRFAAASLLHPTYYHWLSPQLLRSRRPIVATVHDMIHELFPRELDPDGLVAADKRRLVERADLILCNSECTRRDLIRFFPAVAPRTLVTLLASSLSVTLTPGEAPPVFNRPYFVFVGGRETYKNFSTLLTAWSEFSARFPDVQLRVVGGPWLPAEKAAIHAAALTDSIIHEGKASDIRLALLYHHSLALVYPSRYEGFGIPLLEAMRCGTAVITSRSSSLPEVAGEAALYFEPLDAQELVAQLEKIATSPATRARCVDLGQVRSQQFSWSATAAATHAAYQQLLP